MKTNVKNWSEYVLKEAKNHYEIELLLRYAPDMSLYGDVFNKIRAIPGITIVKVKEGETVSSITQSKIKIVKLKVKFIPPPAAMTRYLAFLRAQLIKIKDEQGDKVIAARFITPARPTAQKKA